MSQETIFTTETLLLTNLFTDGYVTLSYRYTFTLFILTLPLSVDIIYKFADVVACMWACINKCMSTCLQNIDTKDNNLRSLKAYLEAPDD